jgi:broad specificity phosphatase PhoE
MHRGSADRSAAVTLYVVRHAHAGSRSAWDGPDSRRPLSKKGRKQAAALAAVLAEAGITHLLSSPAARCTETLDPVADLLALEVIPDDRLLEGADGAGALALADELRAQGADAALCSHGDVIPEMLRRLRTVGTRFTDPFVWPKASTWEVTWNGTGWATARYIAPPKI